MKRRYVPVAVALVSMVLTAPAFGSPIHEPPPPRCENGNCLDPLFTVQFPHTGSAVLRSGVRVPLPLHYYDADLAMTVGYADLDVERRLTKGTPYEPVLTESGRAVGALMFAVYRDDDLGPYNEGLVGFPVHLGATTIPDDDGAMASALLDPTNEVWAVRLVLNEQLPIDAGREYLGIPKVPTPRTIKLGIDTSHVSIDVKDDNTPVVSADIDLDPSTTPGSAADLTSQRNSLAAVTDVLTRSYLRLRFVYDDIRYPGALSHGFAVARVGATASAAIATFGPGSTLRSNPHEPFGSDLSDLGLQPHVSLVIRNLHSVLDATL